MELNITMSSKTNTIDSIEFIDLQKILFINNAIDDGWAVKKRNDKYIFSKKHENKKEVYLETFLQKFIESNLNTKKSH